MMPSTLLVRPVDVALGLIFHILGDGLLQRNEILAIHGGDGEGFFRDLDHDENGWVTPEEWQQ